MNTPTQAAIDPVPLSRRDSHADTVEIIGGLAAASERWQVPRPGTRAFAIVAFYLKQWIYAHGTRNWRRTRRADPFFRNLSRLGARINNFYQSNSGPIQGLAAARARDFTHSGSSSPV